MINMTLKCNIGSVHLPYHCLTANMLMYDCTLPDMLERVRLQMCEWICMRTATFQQIFMIVESVEERDLSLGDKIQQKAKKILVQK